MADLFAQFESETGGYGHAGGWKQQKQQVPANPFENMDLAGMQPVSFLGGGTSITWTAFSGLHGCSC